MGIVKKLIDFVMDILETITFVGSLFIVVYLFIMGPNQVRGASMEPTFHTGDYILTSKITYKFKPLERGDVVVFKSPKNPDVEFIKRIIALPGDEVVFRGGKVYLNGLALEESYITPDTDIFEGGFAKENEPIVVPSGEIFAMGDNRPRSSDSREFGPVSIKSIVGVVFYRYYPPDKIGWVKNPLPKDRKSTMLPESSFGQAKILGRS